MRLTLPSRRACQPFAPRLCFHFVPSRTGLFVGQQLELQIAQRLAAWTQLPNPPLPQLFLQCLDFQLRPVQLPLQFSDARGSVHGGEVLYYANN